MKDSYLIVISSLRGGGAERVASELSNYVSDNNNVIVLVLEDSSISYELCKDVEVLVSPYVKYCKGIAKIILIPFQSYYLSKVVKKRKISNVISFLHRPNIVNSISSLLQRRRFIYSERSLISHSYKGLHLFFMKILLRLSYMNTDVCIAISSSVKKELVDIGVSEDKVSVINNPVFIEKKYSPKSFPKGVVSFCTVGRLVKNKNIDIIILAFKEYLNVNSDSILNIYGVGCEMNNLVKLTESLSISDKVNFKGFSSELDKELVENDCFVFASQYESFGNVIVEAASVGLPIIVPKDLQSLGDIFPERERCLSFHDRTPKEICRAMMDAISTDSYGKYSQFSIETAGNFEKKKILDKYIDIIGG
ncbi:glycosyltransferase [Vibrio alginolyticus]|uniref:glycosyltransferase n=1 Tax=Vibrio alginolyticus TaxID=663 RepID=UPI00215CDC73|nr:glycosyltransferase [Vibrio alginolyticus]MCS0000029.1 glycosyltransferase [Vibrio alginolyticus]